jgi:hypothetical protein
MKMAREGRLRKIHRREWPSFLNRMIPASVWQAFYGQIEERSDLRVRWSAKYIVLCWAIMGWSIQGQLMERFREAFEVLVRWFPQRRRPGASYQGLTQATAMLDPEVVHRFWSCLRTTLPSRVGAAWTWFGWTIIAVDGSRLDAPRTRRNEKGLGRCGRDKTHPQWWVTWAIHLPTSMIWEWRLGSGDSSERDHLRAMLPTLPPGSLVVADIGFGGLNLLRELTQAGVCFVIRCGSNTTLLVDKTRQEIERAGGCRYVHLWPRRGRKSRHPLRLRLIVVKERGRRMYLLTNVMEPARLSRPMAAELYHARWGIEVEYRGLKQTMARRKILARTPEPGEMEAAGAILAMALLLLHAAMVVGAKAGQASVALLLRLIHQMIEATRWAGSTAAFLAGIAEAIKDDYVRRGSKKARDWPHKKKQSPPGPPKLRRPTRPEKACIHESCDEHGTVIG